MHSEQSEGAEDVLQNQGDDKQRPGCRRSTEAVMDCLARMSEILCGWTDAGGRGSMLASTRSGMTFRDGHR